MSLEPQKTERPSKVAKLGQASHWFDEKIREAQTPQEMAQLVKLRGDLLRQEESIRELAHKRDAHRLQLLADITKSSVGLGVGAFLVTHGYPYPGMLLLGASMFSVAPQFVMAFFKRDGGKKDERDH